MERKRVVPQNNKLNYNRRRRKGGTAEAENRDEGPGFHPKKQEMVERAGGSRCTRLPLLENRETNGETGNICQTHIFSDLSRPCFPKSQFNFLAVTISGFRGEGAFDILQITRVIFYRMYF